MAKCIFENLTMGQAKMLADWYEGQGEQDADVWFDVNGEEKGIKTPYTDSYHKGGAVQVRKNGDVVVYCRS